MRSLQKPPSLGACRSVLARFMQVERADRRRGRRQSWALSPAVPWAAPCSTTPWVPCCRPRLVVPSATSSAARSGKQLDEKDRHRAATSHRSRR